MPLRVPFLFPKVGFVSNPSHTSVVTGSASFSITAGSSQGPLTYQWQLSTNNGSTFSDVAGATGTSLSLTGLVNADAGKQYRCVATISGRTVTATSSAGLLYGNPPSTPTPTMSAPSATTARMTWTAPSDTKGYTINGWNLVWYMGTGSPTNWTVTSGPATATTSPSTNTTLTGDGTVLIRGTIQPYGKDPNGFNWTGSVSGYSNNVTVTLVGGI